MTKKAAKQSATSLCHLFECFLTYLLQFSPILFLFISSNYITILINWYFVVRKNDSVEEYNWRLTRNRPNTFGKIRNAPPSICRITLEDHQHYVAPLYHTSFLTKPSQCSYGQLWRLALQSIVVSNNEQRYVVNTVVNGIVFGYSMDRLDADPTPQYVPDQLFSVAVSSETGKLLTTDVVQEFWRSKKRKIVTIASSAVVAQLQYYERTAQWALQIPLTTDQNSTWNMFTGFSLAGEIR